MINFDSRTKFFMKSTPTDMRKGYEGKRPKTDLVI